MSTETVWVSVRGLLSINPAKVSRAISNVCHLFPMLEYVRTMCTLHLLLSVGHSNKTTRYLISSLFCFLGLLYLQHDSHISCPTRLSYIRTILLLLRIATTLGCITRPTDVERIHRTPGLFLFYTVWLKGRATATVTLVGLQCRQRVYSRSQYMKKLTLEMCPAVIQILLLLLFFKPL
jgi:hypothetical protein